MLASFPEELLLRILALLARPPDAPAHTPRNRTAPLLVSRQFFRIAAPLFYHTLRLHSPHQASRVLDTLTQRPSLADAVRRVVFGGIWHDCAAVLARCGRVQDVDLCLNSGGVGSSSVDGDAEAFCTALEQRRGILHLTIRKDPALYLTHPRPAYVLRRLAQAVERWSQLETVHLALRMSTSHSTISLARALSTTPRLRCVRAQLPAVWNTFLLVVSTNARLEKVVLYVEPLVGPMQGHTCNSALAGPSLSSAIIDGKHKGFHRMGEDNDDGAILATGMYMMEAKKHARLAELIEAGTSIVPARAHAPSPGGTTPFGATKSEEVTPRPSPALQPLSVAGCS